MKGTQAYFQRRSFMQGNVFSWRGMEWKYITHPHPTELNDIVCYIESEKEDYLLTIISISITGIQVKGRAPREKKEGGFFRTIYNYITPKNELVICYIKYSEMQGL